MKEGLGQSSVGVIGSGIQGVCISLNLIKKGFKVTIFDKEDPVIEVLNGRYGPYIKSGKKNYKIPKNQDPKKLSRADCLDLISQAKK